MSCRLDKFIWCVRLTKTRSIASQVLNKGKIRLNGTGVKPSKEIKIGDEIQVIKNTATFSYKVIELVHKRIGAKLVGNYILDVTTDGELEKYKLYRAAQKTYSLNESGKPTTKDRRDLNKFLEDWD